MTDRCYSSGVTRESRGRYGMLVNQSDGRWLLFIYPLKHNIHAIKLAGMFKYIVKQSMFFL